MHLKFQWRRDFGSLARLGKLCNISMEPRVQLEEKKKKIKLEGGGENEMKTNLCSLLRYSLYNRFGEITVNQRYLLKNER